MVTVAIGVSDDIDVLEATSSVIEECRSQLAGRKPQAGLLFTSLIDIDHTQLLGEIKNAFPNIELIGCTTDGEIVPGHGFIEDSIALLLFASESVQFAASIATDLSLSAEESFTCAYKKCRDRLESKPVFGITLPDGLTTIGIRLDAVIQSAMGKTFPVFGGTAGDSFKLTKTYQFYDDSVYTDSAPILIFAGDLTVDSKICSGVEPIGPYLSIDSAKDNTVFIIDGQRAADIYEDFLGDYIEERQAIQFPLAVYEEGVPGFYLRDPLEIDKESGSINFIGTFPDACKAKFVAVDREDILQSAHDANNHIVAGSTTDMPELVLVFSCTSRKHTLGTKTKEEFKQLLSVQQQIPFFGFYCYGEIGPLNIGESTLFHNDTYVAVGIRSRS